MIETNHLRLRPALVTDAQDLFLLSSDREVMRYTGDKILRNQTEALEIIQDLMIPQFTLHKMSRLMVHLKDGTFIGWCGLKYFPEAEEVDLGYRFLKRFWGKGYATEAARACLKYGFDELHLQKITARVMPENIPSIKVLQKLGMTFRGHKKDPTDPMPFLFYDINKTEFQKCIES